MTPTHTHLEHGGRYELIARIPCAGSMAGTELVTYHDLEKDMPGAIKAQEWDNDWRAIATDDCSICLGAGTDQIKGNREKPCGGCYGLGKVQQDGEAPTELWELSDIARRVIAKVKANYTNDMRQLADPEVQAFIEHLRQQRLDDSTARAEHEWRNGRGHGPMGQRHTGD